MQSIGNVGALALAATLYACSSIPAHQSLDASAHANITATDVIAPISESEIYVFVPNSNAGAVSGGGLLGVLIDVTIDNIRTGKAEKAVKPLRDSLVGFDFDAATRGALNAHLAQVTWMHAGNARVLKEVTNDRLDAALTESTASATLFTIVDYHLSNDSDDLLVTVHAFMFPNSDALKALVNKPSSSKVKSALANAIYRNVIVYETRLDDATSDRDHNIALWSARNGAAAREALTEGLDKVSGILASDISGGQPAINATEIWLDGQKGTLIASDPGGSLIRRDDGTLLYATRTYFMP